MNEKRLLKLADHLETIKRKGKSIFHNDKDSPVTVMNKGECGFNMDTWFDWDYEGCGTTACALGHACSIPSFRKAGLRMRSDPVDENYYYPDFNGMEGLEAASEFFDIDFEGACSLFYSRGPETPKQVAKRIRKFVKTGDCT